MEINSYITWRGNLSELENISEQMAKDGYVRVWADITETDIFVLYKRTEIVPEQKEDEKDVHTEHCCIIHGCKYGDDDCTVTTKLKGQSYLCETCTYSW